MIRVRRGTNSERDGVLVERAVSDDKAPRAGFDSLPLARSEALKS